MLRTLRVANSRPFPVSLYPPHPGRSTRSLPWACLTSSRCLVNSEKQLVTSSTPGSHVKCICFSRHTNSSIHSTNLAPAQLPEMTGESSGSPEPAVRTELYPPLEPLRTGRLQVSPLHSIYWEESGNSKGKAVLFLHGGPGGGTSPDNRRFFDPHFYRIILLDQVLAGCSPTYPPAPTAPPSPLPPPSAPPPPPPQRGSGESTPSASLVDNTTWHLVEDIEKLREELEVDTWMVSALVLRGIFFLREKEIQWFYQQGANAIFPDAWESYRDAIPESERNDFVSAYHKRLMNEDEPEGQLAAARAWTRWEMGTSYLVPRKERLERGDEDDFAVAFARIENHYFYNKGFFPNDSFLLDNVSQIRHIPAVIVQGRYDVVCPMTSAWDLHKAWPEADFQIISDAGHSSKEVGVRAALVGATEKFKSLL